MAEIDLHECVAENGDGDSYDERYHIDIEIRYLPTNNSECSMANLLIASWHWWHGCLMFDMLFNFALSTWFTVFVKYAKSVQR